jgi:hypothetical protein
MAAIQWRALILGVLAIDLGISEAFDRSHHHHRPRPLKSPWFFVFKGVLGFHRCQYLHQFQCSSLAAIDFGDFISSWSSMAAVYSMGWW